MYRPNANEAGETTGGRGVLEMWQCHLLLAHYLLCLFYTYTPAFQADLNIHLSGIIICWIVNFPGQSTGLDVHSFFLISYLLSQALSTEMRHFVETVGIDTPLNGYKVVGKSGPTESHNPSKRLDRFNDTRIQTENYPKC